MTKNQKSTIWAVFIFLLILFCGFIVISASGDSWGTPDYGTDLFIMFICAFVGAGAVKVMQN